MHHVTALQLRLFCFTTLLLHSLTCVECVAGTQLEKCYKAVPTALHTTVKVQMASEAHIGVMPALRKVVPTPMWAHMKKTLSLAYSCALAMSRACGKEAWPIGMAHNVISLTI